MTPSAVRRGGAAARIRFAVGEPRLRRCCRGDRQSVCAILLGDDPEALVCANCKTASRAPSLKAATPISSAWLRNGWLVEAPGQRLDLRSTSAAPRSSRGFGRR